MIAFVYIITSLLIYPIVGRFIVRQSKRFSNMQTVTTAILCVISLIVLLWFLTHIITISQNLNWFLATLVYLTISVLLWQVVSDEKPIIQRIGKISRLVIFGAGYLAATVGVLFILLFASDMDTDQEKWLTNDLMYQERNIGQGPDPSVRLKKIEVYKKIPWIPFLAYRIKAKTYDEWALPLQKNLDVSFTEENHTLHLSSLVTGYKVFKFEDSIVLSKN